MSLERRLVDGPAGQFDGVKMVVSIFHRFGDEGLDDIGRNPGRTETRGDLAGLEIDRLDRLQRGTWRRHETGSSRGLFAREGELGAHRAGKRLASAVTQLLKCGVLRMGSR